MAHNNLDGFDFPGFTSDGVKTVEDPYNRELLIDTGVIRFAGYNLNLKLSLLKRVAHVGDYLLNVVEKGAQVFWRYNPYRHEQYYCRLAWAGEELVVALVTKERNPKVADIECFREFLPERRTFSVPDRLELKRRAADWLKMPSFLTAGEARYYREQSQVYPETSCKNDADKAERRRKRVEAIMARQPVSVRTSSGREVNGVPVVGDEWQSLPNSTRVVLVEKFDDNGDPQGLIEAFVVSKHPGKNPVKSFRHENVEVAKRADSSPQPKEAKKERVVRVLSKDNRLLAVDVFETFKDIRTLRQRGVPETIYVTALDKQSPDGRWDVFRLTAEGKLESVGLLHEQAGVRRYRHRKAA